MSKHDIKAPEKPSEIRKFLESHNDKHLKLVQKERPYKIPSGYMYWKNVCGIIGYFLLNYHPESFHELDPLVQMCVYRTVLWFVQDAPVYCISTELLGAFEETDIEDKPDILVDLKPPLPTFMLLFPQGAVCPPPPQGAVCPSLGVSLNYVIVHLSDNEYPERSSGSAYGFDVPCLQHPQKQVLHWSGLDNNGQLWTSGSILNEQGKIITAPTVDIEGHLFRKKVGSIILQCLLAFTYTPELVTQDQAEGSAQPSKGFHKQRQKQTLTRTPRWLGKDYTPPPTITGGGGSNHASPRSHWRRGHWRRVVVGARLDQQRKWSWIQPTRVNG